MCVPAAVWSESQCGWEVNVNSHDLWLCVAGGLSWGDIMSGHVSCKEKKKKVGDTFVFCTSDFVHTATGQFGITTYNILKCFEHWLQLIRSGKKGTKSTPFSLLDQKLVGQWTCLPWWHSRWHSVKGCQHIKLTNFRQGLSKMLIVWVHGVWGGGGKGDLAHINMTFVC